MNTQGPTDEGDFSGEALMLSLLGAVWFAEGSEQKTDSEKLAEQLSSLLGSLSEESADSKKASFARTTYVPFFKALQQDDVLVPFSHLCSRRRRSRELNSGTPPTGRSSS